MLVLHSFLWLNSIPLCGYITFGYPFVCWWTFGLFLSFGNYEYCYKDSLKIVCEHTLKNSLNVPCFYCDNIHNTWVLCTIRRHPHIDLICLTPGFSSLAAESSMRNAAVLFFLGRKPSGWAWWEREPLVLGCPNLEWRLYLAELGRGREETIVLVLVSQILMKFFLPNFNFFALMIFHLLFAFKIISRGTELFGFCCNSFHQIDWGRVSRVGSAVVPEVNLLPFCLSSILIMFLYPPFHT